MRRSPLTPIAVTLLLAGCCVPAHSQDLRIGIIGTDSTHAVEFTRLLNDPATPRQVSGAHIVAAYRGGNPELDLSRDRIQAITAQLVSTWHIDFVPAIQDLCPRVDGLLLLSVDPSLRKHEFEQAVACGKPIFVDKPFAPDLATAHALAAYARKRHVPWFSASAMRFGVVSSLKGAKIRSVLVSGPGALRADYSLDLAWYGIHSIEMAYEVMGPGVQTVARLHSDNTDVLDMTWKDGRAAVVRLVRPDASFRICVVDTAGDNVTRDNIAIDYGALVSQIVDFLRSGKPPVANAETLEIFSLMDAAQRSMRHAGARVRVPASRP